MEQKRNIASNPLIVARWHQLLAQDGGRRLRAGAPRLLFPTKIPGNTNTGSFSTGTWVKTILVVVLGFFLVCCANDSTPVPEEAYSTKIIGRWQGTVGNLQETMSIAEGGTFVCKLQPTGFIGTMIFPRAPGMVSGTWNIAGTIMTLNITGEKNERVKNQTATSTIVTFGEDRLVLKSDRGGTSLFQRVHNF